MSDPENFLSRWSRRKLVPEREPEEPQRADEAVPSAPAAAAEGAEAAPGQPKDSKDEPEFDITTLPSLESITAETDIRVFLQKGVPAALSRAALRRAWTADPAIRDFKEIAENQYDFATGSDLPGFGSLDASADDIRKMVANVFGDGPKPPMEPEVTIPTAAETSEKSASSEPAPAAAEPAVIQDSSASSEGHLISDGTPADAVQVHRNKLDIAMQQDNTEVESGSLPARRPHGGALPQ